MNVWDAGEPIRELIRSGRAVDPRDLANPSIVLSELAEAEPAMAGTDALSAWASEGGAL